MLCRLSFLWKQRDLVVLKSSSLLALKDYYMAALEYRTPAPAAATPSLPCRPPCWWGKFTAALLLKLRGEWKKKPLPEINVAAQRAFTMALWSIYIENTIKLSQGEKRKPHVHSVWSPRSPGTSIASLFSPALLWYQIVKEAESMTLYPLTPGLLVFLRKRKKNAPSYQVIVSIIEALPSQKNGFPLFSLKTIRLNLAPD